MSAPFSVCYKGLPSEGKGGCNYGKKSKEKNDLLFISPVHFFFFVKTRQHPSGFVSRFIFLPLEDQSLYVCSQFCNDSVLSALCSFWSSAFLFLISHSPLCPAAANATILVALTRPYAQPLSQNAASCQKCVSHILMHVEKSNTNL